MKLAQFTELELSDIKLALGIAMANGAGKNQLKRWQELSDRMKGRLMKTLVRNEYFDKRLALQGLTLKRYFETLAMQDIAQQYRRKEKDREAIEAEMKRVADENNS